ncbi:hypothetical protein SH139x_000018 [Planctomycetaceae bacterium SH139]
MYIAYRCLALPQNFPAPWRNSLSIAFCIINYLAIFPAVTNAQDVEVILQDDFGGVIIEEQRPANVEQGKLKQQELTDTLTNLIRSEIGFAKRVCDLTPDQTKQLSADMIASIDTMQDLTVDGNQDELFGFAGGSTVIVANVAGGIAFKADPVARVRSVFDGKLAEIAAPDELAKYRHEAKLRETFLRTANIAVVIELLDKQLAFTKEQRDKLKLDLQARWDGANTFSFEMYISNAEFYPVLPEIVMQRVLDKNQRQIWNQMNKHHFPMNLNLNALEIAWDE